MGRAVEGGPLGLKSVTQNTTASKQPTPPAQPTAGQGGAPFVKVLRAAVPPKCDSKQIQQGLDSVQSATNQLNAEIANTESSLNGLNLSITDLTATLDQKENAYTAFQSDYLSRRQTLLNRDADPIVLMQTAYKLQADSLNLSNNLTNDKVFETKFVDTFEAARISGKSLAAMQSDAVNLQNEIKPFTCTLAKGQEGLDSTRGALEKQVDSLKARIDVDMAQVLLDAAKIANTACQYNARKQGEFSWVRDQVYLSVSTVLANPEAFGWVAVMRKGAVWGSHFGEHDAHARCHY
jgi:hypothetical protein